VVLTLSPLSVAEIALYGHFGFVKWSVLGVGRTRSDCYNPRPRAYRADRLSEVNKKYSSAGGLTRAEKWFRVVAVGEKLQQQQEGKMENWTDFTDSLATEDSDALTALAEILPDLPEPEDDPDGGAAPAAPYAEPSRIVSAEPLDSPFFV